MYPAPTSLLFLALLVFILFTRELFLKKLIQLSLLLMFFYDAGYSTNILMNLD
jgi:hypothetical protein